MLHGLVISATATLIGVVLWKTGKHVIHQLTLPTSKYRWPQEHQLALWQYARLIQVCKKLFFICLSAFVGFDLHSRQEELVLVEEWAQEYGQTLKFYGFLNAARLFTLDLRALNHILTHSMDYQKPEGARYGLSQILGEGVVCVEGAQHRQQRRIMNPAFGTGQIRELTEVFLAKSIKLRDILMLESEDEEGKPKQTDISAWTSRMSLDVIGLAGFNYEFNSLDTSIKKNDLNEAIGTVFSASIAVNALSMLQTWIPPLRVIPTDRGRKITVAQQAMGHIGRELLRDAKAAVMASQAERRKARSCFGNIASASESSTRSWTQLEVRHDQA
ncbi:cytochrome P450 [Hygrophoropsis aurantiaca]|uniref:Cytochrome P450 n=1 Tax=Hygrophoropsis aurantiaca TaxID=72124 RepID=A0ACB8ACT5_9AGAM|nr:cytochrome P450 [Hygrophoropsis aurantiaca]